MAGSERSGPLAATAALFDGRPWAITPHAHSSPEAVDLVEALARLCGAEPVRLSPVEHDRAVARTSHLPHLLAVLTAGQLAEAQPEHLSLSGQGVRDVTRIAAGDPDMWGQIIRANQAAVSEILRDVQVDLDRLVEVLASGDEETLEEILTRGVTGTRAIPGKHGGPAIATASVFVSVPDHPGELARLFADVGEIGVNIEDLHIDHDPGRPVGLVELVVEDTAAESLRGRSRDQGMGHPPVRLALAAALPGGVETAGVQRSGQPSGSTVVVAMDGPSGSGKSSTARGVATRLGLRYLDTGAQFRAVTAWMIDHGVDFSDPAAIAARADEPELVSGTDPQDPTITVDGTRRRRARSGRRRSPTTSARSRPCRRCAAGCSSCSARSSARAASSSRDVTSARWWPRTRRSRST